MVQLRFVVIGAGLIGPRHAELVLKHPSCTLFAVVDRSEKGPGVAASYDALHFKTVEEMFEFCEKYQVEYPDAAIIATPNSSHVQLGLMLAQKRVHLLVEKPMASTVEDCLTLNTYCELNDIKLLIGHHRRFNPYIVLTKNTMHQIGHPIAVQGVWALKKPQTYFDEKAWRRSKYHGGGALLINFIHDLDLLQYLLGPIVRVYAEPLPCQRRPEGPDDHVDEGAALTLRFANGCCGTFLCSDNVTSPFNFESGTGENPLIPHNEAMSGFYRIFGTDGTLSVPDMTLFHQKSVPKEQQLWWRSVEHSKLVSCASGELLQASQSTSTLTPPSSFEKHDEFCPPIEELPKPFDLQLCHFVNLITEVETVSKCSGWDAIRALLCIEAVLKSMESGLPQNVQLAESLMI